MITLIDRADGTPLWDLSASDFDILQDQLVRESDQDYDYYLNDGTLELLAAAGMSAEAVTALSSRMRHRGLDLGWEHTVATAGQVYSGSVVDVEGAPLGGIRVDLMEAASLLAWTYVRKDGVFSLSSKADTGGLRLRFSGRGDLILREEPVQLPGQQGVFELQTLVGRVLTGSDLPLAGVNVSLTDWQAEGSSQSWVDLGGRRSWGDTDEGGAFSIPVSLPEDLGSLQLELELTAPDGQSLETLKVTAVPGDGFELGVLRAPEPQPPADPELLPSPALE
jgi:hypothetical protein